MVIVKLMGGLGNQMFQYAAARSLSGDKKILIDSSFLEENQKEDDFFTSRPYELGIFKFLHVKLVNNLVVHFLLKTVKKSIRSFSIIRRTVYITDENINSKGKTWGIKYLDGYFQKPLYFENIREVILDEFTFPVIPEGLRNVCDQIQSSNDSIGIHIRRGDYLKAVNQKVHGILPTSYYIKATELIKTRINNPQYFVFSDDPDWCRNNLSFLGKDYHLNVGDYPAWTDMFLMSQCKHQIIANSSFSWWAAWLNRYNKKIIVTPKQWFLGQLKENDAEALIPPEWIKI